MNLEAQPGNGSLQRASSVTLADGTNITARHEIILSAGAFHSPGLLEVSGIGRKDVLDAAGITQAIDLPGVGENLQDHLDFFISYQLKPGFSPGWDTLTTNATFAAEQLALWRNGSYSQYDQSDKLYVFLNWKQITGGNDSHLVHLAEEVIRERGDSASVVDEAKLAFLSDYSVPHVEAQAIDGYLGTKGYPAEGSPLYGQTFLSIFVEMMHPLSRGSVHVSSGDIVSDPPVIDPNWLSNEYDLQTAVASLRFARQIVQTEPLAGAVVADEEYEPGPDVATDAQLRAYLQASAVTGDHPLGTCAMLPRRDGGVVDPRLRVYGTSNLRVVDASVIPIQPSAHIQTAVYGIAEMAANFIVQEWS